MRRLLLQFLALAILSTVTTNRAEASTRSKHAIELSVSDHPDLPLSPQQEKAIPLSRSHRPEEHGKKAAAPKTEELPHIHHFHKERVRGKRHHRKFWLLSKILLILCHLAILVMAYLHVAPH